MKTSGSAAQKIWETLDFAGAVFLSVLDALGLEEEVILLPFTLYCFLPPDTPPPRL